MGIRPYSVLSRGLENTLTTWKAAAQSQKRVVFSFTVQSIWLDLKLCGTIGDFWRDTLHRNAQKLSCFCPRLELNRFMSRENTAESIRRLNENLGTRRV